MDKNSISANGHTSANAYSLSLEKPIALVGLMGSGKSAVGRNLAKKLCLKFADSDELISKMAGVSIVDIFDLAGETKFRDMEFRTIQKQLREPPHILATGGGAFCEPPTAKLLQDHAIVVWLQASPETLLRRIGDTSSRPLLRARPPLEILQKLAEERNPSYSKAHIRLNTDGMTIPKSILALVSALDSYQAKQ